MNTTVAKILKRKGGDVITISPSATVFEAIGRMVEHNVGSLLATEDGTRDSAVHGIITERDYLRRIALEGRSSKTTQVEEVMTADVVHVAPDTTVEECMALMTEHKCRHLPVLDEDRLAGLLSIGDCVRTLLRVNEQRAEELTRYVAGGYPG
jgi:CBS domain-containing protein